MFGSKFRNLLKPRVRVDTPGLQLVARRSRIDPARLAAAINDPTGNHIKRGELERIAPAISAIAKSASPVELAALLQFREPYMAALDAAIRHKTKGKVSHAT